MTQLKMGSHSGVRMDDRSGGRDLRIFLAVQETWRDTAFRCKTPIAIVQILFRLLAGRAPSSRNCYRHRPEPEWPPAVAVF